MSTLHNIEETSQLRGLARIKKRSYETATVKKTLAEDMVADGWELIQKNKTTSRFKRSKPIKLSFQDRVWSMLYAMDFPLLSNEEGPTFLSPDSDELDSDFFEIVGVDNEIALAIRTFVFEKSQPVRDFSESLELVLRFRNMFALAIRNHYPSDFKKQVIVAFFVNELTLTEEDYAEAKNANILLFTEADLSYYENLLTHVGPAAKYQFFADMLPGKLIPGLSIRVPAIKTKMAGVNCYNFLISPEYLLKISYVSHRAKGKASDVDSYQRMLNKSRIRSIKEYISNNGIFPTNIIVNLDSKRVQFEKVKQESELQSSKSKSVFGWLDIKPTYKSAWIIDGQHRLYAYSGHEKGTKILLSVLAFEGLSPSKQAELFIDINAKQKSVKRSLLQELYSELHWDSEAPEVRVRAIISKAIQQLDTDRDSAFYQRLQLSDTQRDEIRCISLTSAYGAIEKSKFHIAKEKNGHVIEFGPFWAGSNSATLKRTVYIIKSWFNVIRSYNEQWWDAGAGPGGGLAMNDGIVISIQVLRSVIDHLQSQSLHLIDLNDNELFEQLRKYAVTLAEHFKSMSEQEKIQFRNLRGVQGQTYRRRKCEVALHSKYPAFNPQGLEEYLLAEKEQTNLKAKKIIDKIETTLQRTIIEELKREYSLEVDQWWFEGVPKNIRIDVTQRYEQDDGKRGSKERYFDLIHYKKIAAQNWQLFEPLLAYESSGNKEKRTAWLDYLNEKRNIVSHPSSGIALSVEELNQIRVYHDWLMNQLS